MAGVPTLKPDEIVARGFADRLILQELIEIVEALKPSEIAERLQTQGMGLAAVRSLLASNPDRFAYAERRWVPTARLEADGLPLHAQAHTIVQRFGGPMPINLLNREIARMRSIDPSASEVILRRMLANDTDLLLNRRDEVFAADWVFVAKDEPHARAFALNGVTPEEVDAAEAKLGDMDWRQPGAALTALAKLAPISAKVLGALAYRHLSPEDPKAFLLYDWRSFNSVLMAAPGYVFSADGVLHAETETKRWLTLASRLAERISPTIDVEDAAPLEIKPEDVDNMVAKILARDETTTATTLLETMFESTPAVKTFPDDLANALKVLRADSRVSWVGGDRFQKPGQFPEFIQVVPEPFFFVPTDNLNEDNELVDVELTDEGLSTSLRKLLDHPLAMDVLDETAKPTPKAQPEQHRLVLKSIHRELGTFPLCQFQTGWFGVDPVIQEVMFVDPDGRELQVWLNNEARLLFNLLDWWLDQQVESGAVFSLRKTHKPNVFEFEWLDQTDPIVYISNQRMEELRDIASRSEGVSTFDVLREVMAHWPKGADFLTLLWEINVVRRTSRTLLASLLSSYLCFYQRSGSPVWHYDAKKVEQGFDKTKRKFVRKD